MYCPSSYSSHSPPNIGISLQPFEQAISERRVSRPSLRAPLVLTNCSTNNNEQQPITTNQPPTDNHSDTHKHTSTHQHTATHTTNTHQHTHTHAHTYTHQHSQTHTHTHAHTHQQTHRKRTPTHKHQHTHHHHHFRNQLGPDVTGVPELASCGPFSICRYTPGAFLLLETASAFLSTMFLRIPVPSSVLGLCQIRRVACCGTVAAQ